MPTREHSLTLHSTVVSNIFPNQIIHTRATPPVVKAARAVIVFTMAAHSASSAWEFETVDVKGKKICCIGAGYVGGPTMAVIAEQCPDVTVCSSKFVARRLSGMPLSLAGYRR